MIPIFRRHKKPTEKYSSPGLPDNNLIHLKKTAVSLVPGSEGEHLLQDQYGTRQRALKFYDKQVINHLSPVMQDFIKNQEVMFVATSDSHGECDCSARFGLPGFVRVVNQDFLIYPEYRGNGVLASQGNIHENPHIGLIFVDFFSTTVGLHVNGAARIIENDKLNAAANELPNDILNEMQLQGNKKPERWIMIEVEEAYIHCSKHIPLLKKMDKPIEWGTDDMAAKGGDFFQLEQLNLYDRIGGEYAVKKSVDLFYKKIISAPELYHLVETFDISEQIEHLTNFMSIIFAKPNCVYSKPDIATAKKYLQRQGMNNTHFKRLTDLLISTLTELELPKHEINSIMEFVESIS